jgi:MinD-like ATPase involved in chromosome partitioning or flagellar assembly
MTIGVLTAIGDTGREAALVASLERRDLGVRVVRRCIDLPDLLAAAAAGSAQAVVLSADLRRLDRDALTRLAVAGVAVVGLVSPGDEDAERRLRQLGLVHVLPADAPPEQVSAAVLAAVEAGPIGAVSSAMPGFGDPGAAVPLAAAAAAEPPAVEPGVGRVVAVWGPAGAPGRTTTAIGIATEAAELGTRALLVDADTYGGVVAQLLGLLDEAPGLAAACRAANAGALDVASLAGFARALSPRLSVLTGISRADRWPELRPAALEVVLTAARSLAELTVVDCGFSLEQDEELVYDVAAPRRNGATTTALEAADVVLAVGSADPVGLQRLVRGLADLRELVPGADVRVVVNRLRRGPTGPGQPEQEIATALERYAGVERPWFVPFDLAATDAALAAGRALGEVAPDSVARAAHRAIAADLSGRPAAPGRRRARVRG